jgi:AcrR family transcriptional regulator
MVREAFKKLPARKRRTIINSGITEFSQKSYSEASTDEITKNSGISKGLLFHYFESKARFYCYCLDQTLDRPVTELPSPEESDFYETIFSSMHEKSRLCCKSPEETRFVNMAARETNGQVFDQKNEVLSKYARKRKEESVQLMTKAASI